MTDATVDELKVFASYRFRWSSGPEARGAGKVLALAGTGRTPDEIISMLRLDEPGDARAAAIGFVNHFRVPVRDEHVDAVLAARRLREAGLGVDSETEERAEAATAKETCLAAMIDAAEIRDTVRGMLAILSAQDEAAWPPFSWLRRAQERNE